VSSVIKSNQNLHLVYQRTLTSASELPSIDVRVGTFFTAGANFTDPETSVNFISGNTYYWIQEDSSWINISSGGGGSGNPAGSPGQYQFNLDNSEFGASSNLSINSISGDITATQMTTNGVLLVSSGDGNSTLANDGSYVLRNTFADETLYTNTTSLYIFPSEVSTALGLVWESTNSNPAIFNNSSDVIQYSFTARWNRPLTVGYPEDYYRQNNTMSGISLIYFTDTGAVVPTLLLSDDTDNVKILLNFYNVTLNTKFSVDCSFMIHETTSKYAKLLGYYKVMESSLMRNTMEIPLKNLNIKRIHQ